jgi:hypothetical protein
MIVPRLGIEGGFRVLLRLVGRPEDFRDPHVIQLTLTDPNTDILGALEHPVAPRAPAPTARPGDEINHHLRADVRIPLDSEGGYDLALALDGERDQRHTIAITVVMGQ